MDAAHNVRHVARDEEIRATLAKDGITISQEGHDGLHTYTTKQYGDDRFPLLPPRREGTTTITSEDGHFPASAGEASVSMPKDSASVPQDTMVTLERTQSMSSPGGMQERLMSEDPKGQGVNLSSLEDELLGGGRFGGSQGRSAWNDIAADPLTQHGTNGDASGRDDIRNTVTGIGSAFGRFASRLGGAKRRHAEDDSSEKLEGQPSKKPKFAM